jgi:hypothetical protein
MFTTPLALHFFLGIAIIINYSIKAERKHRKNSTASPIKITRKFLVLSLGRLCVEKFVLDAFNGFLCCQRYCLVMFHRRGLPQKGAQMIQQLLRLPGPISQHRDRREGEAHYDIVFVFVFASAEFHFISPRYYRSPRGLWFVSLSVGVHILPLPSKGAGSVGWMTNAL